MSNLYVTEPATNGKIIIDTTAGEIEVELWGKEAPKTVRNFLTLAMEGYYDGIIFHRVVPGFIVQSGDPTGTGMGGESFYGEPFEDEIHQRLKFNRRGLLGMANNGKRHTNTSQFFLTLDKAEELTGKHTLFGKITGPTIFNVLNIGNLDLDKEERPMIPPKIKGITILENPFDDIVPRITIAEKKAQLQARADAKREIDQKEKKAKAKKNTALLSFGEAEEIPEETGIKKKSIVRPDLVDPDAAPPTKATEAYVALPASLRDLGAGSSKDREKKAAVDLKEIRAQHDREKEGGSAARQAEIKKMQDSLRKLKKRTGENSDSDSDTSSMRRRKKRRGPSYLDQELAKYSKGRGRAADRARKGRREDDEDLLNEMGRFSHKIQEVEYGDDGGVDADGMHGEDEEDGEDTLEVDDDVGWMSHKLRFAADEKETSRRAEEDYTVIDPRAKAKELADKSRSQRDGQRRGGRTAGDVGRERR
ncbi:peptidyl-prolyl cis-trans isomerase SDCCAG10, partial [Tremellales sp. Uapishka_1]